MDKASLNEIANVYSLVVKAGVYKASSIKVAEAAKVIENSQRDINIAFMNELSIIFNEMGIDAGTKITIKAIYYEYVKDAVVTPQAMNAILVSINSGTAIDNTTVETKAVKRIENGMLVIEKDGVRYNAFGQVIR